ncbi:AlpA family phage regulatory protein [Ottowia beijingensis]|uniref:AlpA family phage regulatory protein n=1 Tax=Ottowia beijingensis TaxID=1207057 RepID=A0A853IIN6_9BURK|nr:AlpA family phage regulatory protein [Ottowia beijingensis]NZA00583.1 AlpA family phage regulatory protein [Ottowia beijingensis]NZA03380.1 AlpA family phage regulatory protein [Ottowia beijingensis]
METKTTAPEAGPQPTQQPIQPIAAVMPTEGFVAVDQMFSLRPRGDKRGRTGFTPFGRTAFYGFIKDGVIPKPKRLGKRSIYTVDAARDVLRKLDQLAKAS